ncbi:MAG: DmsE family decaheme c-type cytochrome [Alphaproteobacteria bacterium]|nr:DmsE family decaheme c-type cytochrome [Alphaproteobacteria bacterium]
MRGFAILSLLCGLMVCMATPTLAADAPRATNDAALSAGGSATCMQCHNSAPVSDILKTPHAMKGDARSPFGQQGCEACHGPSDAHASGFAKGTPTEPGIRFNGPNASPVAQRNQVCLGCHQDAKRMDWDSSKHHANNLACVSCHTIHVAKDPVLVRTTQPEKCFSCHAQQRAESFQYSHHPIREGKVVCSDCHNPHGSAGPSQLKEFTVNQTCYNCHADKRGPMLWEHQPVRENCLNCHTPHGSSQPRLMKEPMNFLCSSCHSSSASHYSGGAFGGKGSVPGSIQATASSALANQRTCVNCHSQVHGSNSPNGTWFFR